MQNRLRRWKIRFVFNVEQYNVTLWSLIKPYNGKNVGPRAFDTDRTDDGDSLRKRVGHV